MHVDASARLELDDLPLNLQPGELSVDFAEDLTDELNGQPNNIREEVEKNLILKMLQKTNYNKKQTAKLLNMSRNTLYNKLDKYGISTSR